MNVDVVIIGGGPNGLLLAGELTLAGVRPIVLEKLTGPSTMPKANGLVGQVVQMLDRRGLYQRLTGQDGPPRAVPSFAFGGLPLPLHRLPDNPVYILPIPQAGLEKVLEEQARELGVDLRRGHEVTGVKHDADEVTIDVAGPEGEYRLHARYLVGCDGGGSLVRKAADIGFPGITDESFVSRSGLVALPPSHLDPLTGAILVPGVGVLPPFGFHRFPGGVFAYGNFQPGTFRVSVLEWHQPDSGPEGVIAIGELRAASARVLGAELPFDEVATAGAESLRRRPGVNSRQADRYREGRIFLVGDAAHVHSGVGGPGLNLGMQDAINLGWKLAAEVSGWAPPGLLDSHQAERFPLGQKVLMHTRAQMALLEPGDNITALRQLMGDLLDDESNTRRIAQLMAGADARYDTFAPETGRHELTGRWLPDLPVPGLLHRVRPVLLDLTEDGLGAMTHGWADRVDLVTVRQPEIAADALLLRPDGYVAWATGTGQGRCREEILAAIRAALHTWCGPAQM